MVDRETAATLREWLFENAVEKHGESDISEPLANLAAAIDGELHEQAEAVELGASARTTPPTSRDASLDDRASVDNHPPDDADFPAEPAAFDADASESDHIYDTLPDSAWQLGHDQPVTNQDNSPTTSYDKKKATSNPHIRQQNHHPQVRYRTSYECSVCGEIRELETSLRVCAFVDECVGCGAVARFTAVEIPTPLSES
ncbi:hypothetical protein HALDL1_00840 (plasmid) [Halobacterium sp. DL1]|nr:hypothetical protein HALDL1_00840 [Halobacterium sp. DL1]